MRKISIITINRNNKLGLQRTIESLLFQTFLEYEFIIIDGSSTDGSVDIIKQFEDKVDYWISSPDSGIYNAMNKGIKAATAEYCLFMNSGDCFCHDNVLKEIFLHNLSGDIICGNALFEKSQHHDERIVESPSSNYKASNFILSSIPHQSTLLKTELFHDIHFYDESYLIFSDWAFVLEMIFIYKKKYQKINVLISRCDTTGISSNPENVQMMESEYHLVLRTILPEFYSDYLELQNYNLNATESQTQILNKIANSILFKTLLKFRKKIIHLGLYELKNKIKKEYNYFRIRIEDKREKKRIAKLILDLHTNYLPVFQSDEPEIIISLTTYGTRVKDSAPYAIYSLFNQKKLPNRIILFLDDENWNDNKLPKLLKHFQTIGLEIYYCSDTRSYKKLIPALEKYPDSVIVTVDDDVYYNQETLSELYNEYIKSDRKSVISHWAAVVERRNGKFTLPSEWQRAEIGNSLSLYAPIGVGGVLYPPHIFDSEIFNYEVFQKLAPFADDLWFWVMELRNHVNVILLENSSYKLNKDIDRLNQLDDRKSDGLFIQNCLFGTNDVQLKNIFEHYQIS